MSKNDYNTYDTYEEERIHKKSGEEKGLDALKAAGKVLTVWAIVNGILKTIINDNNEGR